MEQKDRTRHGNNQAPQHGQESTPRASHGDSGHEHQTSQARGTQTSHRRFDATKTCPACGADLDTQAPAPGLRGKERALIIEELLTPEDGERYTSAELLVANKARREWEALAMKWYAEKSELEQTLNLIHDANMRATKRWQAEKPGRNLTWPDLTELIVWLLKKLPENPSEPSTL